MIKHGFVQWLGLALFVTVGGFWLFYEPPKEKPFALPEATKTEPWPVQSGLKIAKLRDRIPTVNRVVLVPDEATFLAAIRQWNLSDRWPILIEDDKYAPMFVDRFQPEEIIRLPAVETSVPTGLALRQAMQTAVANAWDATDLVSLTDRWEQLGWQPPGVIVTSTTDPAWPAAVALASDRGQPLVFLEDDFGKANDRLTLEQWQTLKTKVEQLVKNTGYAYASLGDAIDTLTVVKEIAVKYQSPKNENAALAVTDGLGRQENGDRWAIAGWIYGSPERAVYQAMSAIFLDPETALLYDSYPPESPWNNYEMNEAASSLRDMGINVQVKKRPEANRETWQKLSETGLEVDSIWINSKGMEDRFAVGDGEATVEEIPQLKYPAIVHMIHSWSATTPSDRNTVAGRWLENGAYLYVGSVHEPLLQAFIPPKLLAKRLQRSTPFLIAARQLESEPWRITTIGDPLMIISQPRQRISPTERPLQSAP